MWSAPCRSVAGSFGSLRSSCSLRPVWPRMPTNWCSSTAPGRNTLESLTGTPPLVGYLGRPDLPGRLPAVVVLHWCSGFGRHDIVAALTLKSWGYVALAPDSLGGANL